MLSLSFSDFLLSSELPVGFFRYAPDVVREVRAEHGLNAPIALHAGLIHQESRWRPDAKSPVGASGLAQFMPSTARWMKDLDSRLAGANTLDPRWSIRAMAVYTSWLNDRFKGYDKCQKWAFSLSGYNGGIGWVRRDQKLAEDAGDDRYTWFDNVEKYSDRSEAAFKENRHYVDLIIKKWQKLYYKNGFKIGGYVCQQEQ